MNTQLLRDSRPSSQIHRRCHTLWMAVRRSNADARRVPELHLADIYAVAGNGWKADEIKATLSGPETILFEIGEFAKSRPA